ncbi:Hsp20/alpha crystallin family protein [Bacillus xiapuensis]|uniref:Hsp20/alpha crystallin family protein n=1 Tax=Bacillus xiapuensis TaxID=2014075 RepID=UPI000C23EF26|nr:Hsp20/alpha crystallin family protein [Bacillus xiapuensis]
MDIEKFKQWMNVAQQYHSGEFWNSVFEQVQPKPSVRKQAESVPAVDIFADNSQIVLIIELPGLTKEDVQLSVTGNTLTIQGQVKQMLNGEFLLNERYYGEFKRTIQLPEPVESKNVSAKFYHGLLILSYYRSYAREEPIFID